MTTGKDYDYIRDHMDLPRIKSLNEYQTKFPPADVGVQRLCRLVEAFMGIDESPTVDVCSDDDDDLFADLQNFPQGN